MVKPATLQELESMQLIIGSEEYTTFRTEIMKTLKESISKMSELYEIREHLSAEEYDQWRQELLVSAFKWGDAEENIGVDQPEFDVIHGILECAELIASSALESLSVDHFNGSHFDVPIDGNLHRLLQERFNSKWSDESRIRVFEVIQNICNSVLLRRQVLFDNKINDDIMPSAGTRISISKIELFDDPIVLDSDDAEASSNFYVHITT